MIQPHYTSRFRFYVIAVIAVTTLAFAIPTRAADHGSRLAAVAADETTESPPSHATVLVSDKNVEVRIPNLIQIVGAAFLLDVIYFNTLTTNGGPFPINGVVLTIILPLQFNPLSITAPAGWTCGEPEQNAENQQITCEPEDGTMAAGAEAGVAVEVEATETGNFHVTAEGIADEFDPNEDNNADTVTLTIEESGEAQALYVDAAATGANDGSSWENAFVTLQDALDEVEMAGQAGKTGSSGMQPRSRQPADFEIHIAEGTYYPDEDVVDNDGDGSLEHQPDWSGESFTISRDRVHLLGGYPSGGGTRDPAAHPTILSGDIMQDDEAFDPMADSDDNATTPQQTDHIVGENAGTVLALRNSIRDPAITPETVIDGFTIQSSRSSSGHGIQCSALGTDVACSPTISNVSFSANAIGLYCVATAEGGNCSPQLDGVTFHGNANGMRNTCSSFSQAAGTCSVSLDDAVFSVNGQAFNADCRNGTCNPTFNQVTFSDNGESADGGAFFAECPGASCSPTFTGPVFTNNTAGDNGNGGALSYTCTGGGTCNLTISDARFEGNSAGTGGAVYVDGGTSGSTLAAAVSTSTFTGNVSVGRDGGAVFNRTGNLTLTNVDFTANEAAGSGGALYHEATGSSLTITGGTFLDNSSGVHGGAVYNRGSSASVAGAIFLSNAADQSGGAVVNDAAGAAITPAFLNIRFIGNTARGFGGGAMYNFCASDDPSGVSPQITNSLFSGNASTFVSSGSISGGGAIFIEHEDACTSELAIINSSFAGNSAAAFGGAILNDGALVDTGIGGSINQRIANTILFGNTAGDAGGQIHSEGHVINNDGVTLTMSYSLVEGGVPGISENNGAETVDGGGNIDGDPLFVDADGADDTPGTDDDDLRLAAGSPAIDAGDNSAVPAGVTTDVTGTQDRFFDVADIPDTGNGTAPLVDMGAVESDGTIDVSTEEVDTPAPMPMLHPSFPNPSRRIVTIAFDVPQTTRVRLAVYDLLGREVAVLADETIAAGRHAREFDAARLAAGLYLYEIVMDDFREVQTMTVVE